MSDTSQVAMSWILIFLVFIFALLSGEFIGKASKLSSFHAQVNPIIERYGGDSNEDLYNNGTNAQKEIQKVSNSMNTKFMSFTVDPKTDDTKSQGDNHPNTFSSSKNNDIDDASVGHENSAHVGYGKPVSYSIHVKIPFIHSLALNNHPTYYTTSKVGMD